jgi:hypothetical protein
VNVLERENILDLEYDLETENLADGENKPVGYSA